MLSSYISLIDEYEEDFPNNYSKFVIFKIQQELDKFNVVSLRLSNSSNIHTFITTGIIRINSNHKTVEWINWKIDLLTLLEILPGKDRLDHWNNLFNSTEQQDVDEFIDVIMFK